MWNIMKYVCAEGIVYRGLCGHRYADKRRSVRLWVGGPFTHQIHAVHNSVPFSQTHVVTSPPWRVLFFGTDSFAEESLKHLFASSCCRQKAGSAVVKLLEVVTLPKDLPVRRFALQNQLRVHDWPNVNVQDRFDVGVVVSFGCLLREDLICQFPYGILNIHPSLLPRWRGPAPVFHTVLHGDSVSGVTVMQIRPKRFDVGPILNQCIYPVPENATAEELGETLATMGAKLLIDTLQNLPECVANRREQPSNGVTSAPKISTSMSWIVWEEHTCDQIDRLFRAIGSRIPLRTLWMGEPIKLLDFVGKFHTSLSGAEAETPGTVRYDRESDSLLVSCKDGRVAFRAVMLKKRLSALDFYNGYLHPFFLKKLPRQQKKCVFGSYKTKESDTPLGREAAHKVQNV
ncbi:methionyl-tRNA formyltransferase, mitochondrial [Brienomyrus brachyistius]|uniref:methionyl-tRNA formyltransferase, mitochondrial n=1 Tax=Brienomyrus brachyistius TaxID=42636 RepID=UPI0020B3171F|nr:methionyl-tRNA formyltransferase, mitochondrial [Brienomyrus brachyistius]